MNSTSTRSSTGTARTTSSTVGIPTGIDLASTCRIARGACVAVRCARALSPSLLAQLSTAALGVMEAPPSISLASQVQEFTERSFCVIPNALSATEVRSMSKAFDEDRRRYPLAWQLRGQSRDGGEVGEGEAKAEALVETVITVRLAGSEKGGATKGERSL